MVPVPYQQVGRVEFNSIYVHSWWCLYLIQAVFDLDGVTSDGVYALVVQKCDLWGRRICVGIAFIGWGSRQGHLCEYDLRKSHP